MKCFVCETQEVDGRYYDRESKRLVDCCSDCGDEIVTKDCPEYIIRCQNCDCLQGVN